MERSSTVVVDEQALENLESLHSWFARPLRRTPCMTV